MLPCICTRQSLEGEGRADDSGFVLACTPSLSLRGDSTNCLLLNRVAHQWEKRKPAPAPRQNPMLPHPGCIRFEATSLSVFPFQLSFNLITISLNRLLTVLEDLLCRVLVSSNDGPINQYHLHGPAAPLRGTCCRLTTPENRANQRRAFWPPDPPDYSLCF